MNFASSTAYPTFQLEKTTEVPSLGLTILEYHHKKTGAKHIHLAADKQENVFVVAFPTIPRDSTGVAHILEHTVLCGSEKYPVRDPFFMMMRRSLNTFMNAFTSSDWTAFPFATQNSKDFQNLLSVYLDAAFFSRIHPLDFAQEGHRLEFADGADSSTPLEIKGVVYNEMKGAMSSPVSQLYQALKKHLYPTTTYHFNSGGEPDVIPSLTYDQLMEFYKTHYHPSNAFFVTFGHQPASQHQEQMETLCLHRFEAGKTFRAPCEVRKFSTTYVQESYSHNEPGAHCHFLLGWLLPELADNTDELTLDLLNSLLCGNSAAPLKKALETAGFGTPSSLLGGVAAGREPFFAAGFQGCKAEDREAMQALIEKTLEDIVATGFDQDDIDAGLFQLELHQKHVSGHNQPYGLELALSALNNAIYDRDVGAAIDIAPAIESLKQRLINPAYLQNFLKDHVIDNKHRVSLLLTPDTTIASAKKAHEEAQLAQRKSSLSPDEVAHLLEQAQALSERQAKKDDESVLPKLELTDIPPATPFVKPHPKSSDKLKNGVACSLYAAKTNGLVFSQAAMVLPDLTPQQVPDLNILSHIWAEVGSQSRDYIEVQKKHFSNTGYLSASLSVRPDAMRTSNISGYVVMRANTLNSKFDIMLNEMKIQQDSPRFDETNRLRELIDNFRHRAIQSITGRGHSLAMNAANAGYHSNASFTMDLNGLAFIRKMKDITDVQAILDEKVKALQSLHSHLLAQPQHLCVIGDEQYFDQWLGLIENNWQQPLKPKTPLQEYPLKTQQHQAWLTSTQTNFCAMSIPAVDRLHPDAPALEVLSVILRNEFLHTALREKGGAYGGGAFANSKAKTFDFYTYRDPRISPSFTDFQRSMDWAMNTKFSKKHREEAILSIISGVDKPGSPSGEATEEFYARLHGRLPEERQAYRQAILDVTVNDLARVAQTYFQQSQHTKVVVTNKVRFDSEGLQDFVVSEI